MLVLLTNPPNPKSHNGVHTPSALKKPPQHVSFTNITHPPSAKRLLAGASGRTMGVFALSGR